MMWFILKFSSILALSKCVFLIFRNYGICREVGHVYVLKNSLIKISS